MSRTRRVLVPESDIYHPWRPNHRPARIFSDYYRIRHLLELQGLVPHRTPAPPLPMSGSDCLRRREHEQAGRRDSLAKLLQPVLPSFYQIPRLIWIRPFTRSSAKLWLNWISLIKIYPLNDVCYVLRTISPSDLFLRSGSVLPHQKQDMESYLEIRERTVHVLWFFFN